MTIITSAQLPKRADCFHDEATIVSGNALAPTVNTSQPYNGFSYQNPANNGDSFSQSFFIRAGTYTIDFLGVVEGNSAILDWYLDGTLIISGQDWYGAGTTYNVDKTATGIVIPNDGYHVLRGAVNGKNGASGGYELRLTKLWLRQVSD